MNPSITRPGSCPGSDFWCAAANISVQVQGIPAILTSPDIPHTLRQIFEQSRRGSTWNRPRAPRPSRHRRRPGRNAESRQRWRDRRPGTGNRRLPIGHRRPKAERDRYDLRSPRHPDTDLTRRMRSPACASSRSGTSKTRVRGVDRRVPHAEARHLPDRVRARLPQRRSPRSRTPRSTAFR